MNVVAFALGALGWTLAEYVIHRFDGHGMKGKTRFSREHLAHHADPTYFAPTRDKLIAASIAATVLLALTVPLVGWGLGGAFTLGFVLMYGTYEVVHRRIHTHAPPHAYARWARRHHLQHHHGNPGLNHGVTTSLWDHVFGTYQAADVVKVPYRRAPQWLRDPETGRVAEPYAADFAILGRAPGEA
ncbi:MAG: sterol desaturase family protein [Myxococcota bacterium]